MLRAAFLDIAGKQLIDSAVIWDLCAGSGAVGLEALSWGAEHCIFVEKNPRAASFIRKTLRDLDSVDSSTVINRDIRKYVSICDSRPDVVFIDPPYSNTDLYKWIFVQDWRSILSVKGAVFVECGRDEAYPDEWNRRIYGDSVLMWNVYGEAP